MYTGFQACGDESLDFCEAGTTFDGIQIKSESLKSGGLQNAFTDDNTV